MTSRLVFRLPAVCVVTATLLLVAGGPARAGVITLDAVDSGFYNFSGGMFGTLTYTHNASNKSYQVIRNTRIEVSSISNNYFVFDLSGVSGQVTSAQLVLSNPTGAALGYTLFDVSTPISDLVANQSGRVGTGSLAESIFNDLGGGTPYSSQQSIPGGGSLVTIPLNDAALQALTEAEGRLFAIGGAITTGQTLSLFGNTGQNSVRQLVIEVGPAPVPEPSAFTLLGLGAVALLSHGWRRRRKQAA